MSSPLRRRVRQHLASNRQLRAGHAGRRRFSLSLGVLVASVLLLAPLASTPGPVGGASDEFSTGTSTGTRAPSGDVAARSTDPQPPVTLDAQLIGGLLARGTTSMGDVRAWPRGRVTWATDVPRRYRWSVRQGVRAWNRTHTGVRFVKRPWGEAELHIRVGRTNGSAALATVGYQPRSRDRVVLQRTSIRGWRTKQLFGRVVAHELGHVLGLLHNSEQSCGLMHPVVDIACSPAPVDGRFECRWVSRPSGKAIERRYGGTFSPGPRTCRL